MKQCTGSCSRLLPTWKFTTRIASSDGLNSKCVDCFKEYNCKNQDYIRNRQREYRANMYPGQWDTELKKQNYKCALPSCHCKENLVADHDHKTGKFRAILCQLHNTGLGHFDDNPQMLREAADYLEKHAGS